MNQQGGPGNACGGLPVAGEVWGPVITHAGTMEASCGGVMRHKYYYNTANRNDTLVDYILTSEIFQTKDKMYEHIKSVMQDSDVIIQSDPGALEGKYLEVLTTKSVPSDKVKKTCHSYKTTPAFCHQVGGQTNNHITKMMYSMVKETGSGKAFPCIFFSHQGCSEANNKASCYWVTHINEVVIIDKYLV